MKVYLAVLILVVGLLGCSSDEQQPDNTAPGNAAAPEKASVNTNEPEEEIEVKSEDAKASRTEIQAKDAAETGLGPTDTIRALNDAVVKKDATKIKSLISRASLKMIEDSAKQQGTTIDKILTAEDGAPMPVEREMINEKIDGDNATVEVKNTVLGNYDKMFLVKENGNWRIALDKFRDEMIKRMNEMQKNAPKVN